MGTRRWPEDLIEASAKKLWQQIRSPEYDRIIGVVPMENPDLRWEEEEEVAREMSRDTARAALSVLSPHTLIVTGPAEEMRYPGTAGDWLSDDPRSQTIVVVAMPDWRHEFLIALHELVEAALCNQRCIKEADVTAFDKAFAGDGEPGDDPRAPYFHEHQFATSVERKMAQMLAVDWDEYAAAVEAAMKPGG